MAQLILEASNVYEAAPTDPPYTPSAFVGTNPWESTAADYLDTYTTGWTTAKTGSGQFAHIAGDFPLPTAPRGVMQMSVFMHYTARNVGPSANGGRAEFSFVRPSDGALIFSFTVGDPGDPDSSLDIVGAANNLLWQPQPGFLPMGLQGTVEALAGEGGFTLITDRLSYPGDQTGASPLNQYRLTIYSLAVTLDYEEPPPTGSQLRVPGLRQLQRGGAGGIGGIPRAVGNPTRQASPRRGSGIVL